MNFKLLTIEQMNRVSSFWTNAAQQGMFVKIPALQGIREDVEDAHRGLRVYVPLPTAASPQLTENREKATEKDRRHDRWVRAGIFLLQAAAELSDSEEEEAAYRMVLDVTYPDGIATTGMSYEEEAGAADLRQKRLTDEQRGLMKGVTFQQTNVLELVDGAIASALELGELERQKRKLEQEPAAISGGTASEAKRAQYEWIEMAKMVMQHTGRALKKGKITQQEHDDFLEPLMNAAQVAEKRRSEKPEEPKKETIVGGASIDEEKKETD